MTCSSESSGPERTRLSAERVAPLTSDTSHDRAGERLGCYRTFVDEFFAHDNHRHRHSGIGLHTPADAHFGRADQIRAQRQTILDAAYNARPDRFRRPPLAPRIPEATWINEPPEKPLATTTN